MVDKSTDAEKSAIQQLPRMNVDETLFNISNLCTATLFCLQDHDQAGQLQLLTEALQVIEELADDQMNDRGGIPIPIFEKWRQEEFAEDD